MINYSMDQNTIIIGEHTISHEEFDEIIKYYTEDRAKQQLMVDIIDGTHQKRLDAEREKNSGAESLLAQIRARTKK